MSKLYQILSESIATGLERSTVTSCSKWAERYRVMGQPFPGPWNFKHHPWLKEMHDAEEEMIIGQKAAQMGYTEVALNKAFYSIDVLGESVLYLLPSSKPDASDFSTSRFDPALEMSEHLQRMFSDVKNVHHKRAGNANLFIRGTGSRKQVKSLPVGKLIADEVDEMNQANLVLAFDRLSGQLNKQSYLISTPTIENAGINFYYKSSTQDEFYFRCPHCNKYILLKFPESMVITADTITDPNLKNTHLICYECNGILHHHEKPQFLNTGKWISTYSDRDTRGFHINQMYSMVQHPKALATQYLRAQTNPADEQEFFNSKLGKTHAVEGASITDSMLESVIKNHVMAQHSPTNSFITMGIDTGPRFNHYEIDQWYFDDANLDVNLSAHCKVLRVGTVQRFEELDLLMRDFGVSFAVIDANPERRKALEFAQRWWGIVKLCFYSTGISTKQIKIDAEEEHTIKVDRTSWLDLSLGRFRGDKISLPKDIPYEYRDHLKNLTRVYLKDADGNPVGRYVTPEHLNDHYAHARNYAEIALQLGVGLGGHQRMENEV